MKKKVLITGGSGFLGQYLNAELSKKFTILTTFKTHPGNCTDYNSALIELRNPIALQNLFKNFQPEIVIHTAAYSTPDICSRLPKEEILSMNVNLIADLVSLCNEYSSKLIFTSTDLVYKSNETLNDSLIDESGTLEPKSFYAETKIAGEEIIQKESKDYIILRTSLLYGLGLTHTKTHFENMLDTLENGEKVNLFFNQYRTPLEAKNGAEIISELLAKDIKNEIINFGGSEKISRYEMGLMVCDKFGFDKSLIVKTDGKKLLGDIFVPDVSMNTSRLQSFGIKQKTISEVLKEIKKARSEN
jgi:dTDP-4-dehydrorhamnose reductase